MKKYLVGADEVGRGCLFGPVVAAAVILGNYKNFDLKDSKKLSEKKRVILLNDIKKNATKISIGEASVNEIDLLNIKEASLLAMKRAILGLKFKNIEVIVDGIDIPKINYPCKAIIKADDKIPEVMAASIVAKVHRDNLMIALSKKYPDFSLEKNKGYPTKEHLNILKSLGPTKYHRKSYKPVLDAR
jgi:ribonuclease HII